MGATTTPAFTTNPASDESRVNSLTIRQASARDRAPPVTSSQYWRKTLHRTFSFMWRAIGLDTKLPIGWLV